MSKEARAALVERMFEAVKKGMNCWGACTPDGPLRCNCQTAASAALDIALEEAARVLYGCTRFDQEIFDSMVESRDGAYIKVEDADAAIRAIKSGGQQ